MMLQHIKCFPVSAMEWKKSRGRREKGEIGHRSGGGLEEFLFHKDWPFSLWPSVFSWWKAPLLVSWHSFARLCAWGTFNLASDTHWSMTLPNKWGFVQTKRLPDRNCKLGAWYPVGKAGYGWAGTGNSAMQQSRRRSHPLHAYALSDLPRLPLISLCLSFRYSSSTAQLLVDLENGTHLHYKLKLTLNSNGTYLYSFILQSTFTNINPFDIITS